jgi:hypothetical protein
MKTLIRIVLEKYAPRLRYAITSIKHKYLWSKRYGDFQTKLKKKLFGKANPVILSGPFKGMYYINEIVWGSITSKWLGTYE